MNQKSIYFVFAGILVNLGLFWAAYSLKLPLLPYHAGTMYISAMVGSAGGVLTTIVTFCMLSLFVYEKNYFWFVISGIFISAVIGGQCKKETRTINWLMAAGEAFVCDLFFYILITILAHDCIPYDYRGQRIFMFFYESKLEEVFSVAMAGTLIVLLSSVFSTICALLGVLLTPKKLIFNQQPSEDKGLKRQKQKNHAT